MQTGLQQLGDKPAGQGSEKPARMGPQHNAESHREAARKPGNHDLHESREVGGPEERRADRQSREAPHDRPVDQVVLPTFPQAQSATQNTGHLRDGRAQNVPLGETRHRLRARVLRTFGRTRGSGKGIPKVILCGAQVPQGRAPRATWREDSRLFFQRKTRENEKEAPQASRSSMDPAL